MSIRDATPPWWRTCMKASMILNLVVIVDLGMKLTFWEGAPDTIWVSVLAMVLLVPPGIYSWIGVRYWKARVETSRRELRDEILVEHRTDGSFPEYCVACKEEGHPEIWPCSTYLHAMAALDSH